MNRKRKFSKPFDLAHSIMFSTFPKEYTELLGIPGEFVKKINRRVHLKDGTSGEMDSAYIADPDFDVMTERVAVALEHQSRPVNDEKLHAIGNYDTQLVVDEHLPTFLVVASHLNKEKSRMELVRSPSDITRLYFPNLDGANISKRLNNVNEIIENNAYLSTENALNLGVIVLYAPRNHAGRITEEVVNLYSKVSRDLDFKVEFTLYSVITLMIDAFFDDENDYKRLCDKMNKNTSDESIEKFDPFDFLRESLEYANERIADLEAENKRLKEKLQAK